MHRFVSVFLFGVFVFLTGWSAPFGDSTVQARERVTPRAGFLNGSFEADASGATAVTNWTIVGAGIDNRNGPYTDKIDLGVTVLGGCVSQDTTDYDAIAATGLNPTLAVWRDDDSFNPRGLNSSNWLTTEANVTSTMAAGVPIVAGNSIA